LLKLFEEDKTYTKVIDGYSELIENKKGIKIIKYNRENWYI